MDEIENRTIEESFYSFSRTVMECISLLKNDNKTMMEFIVNKGLEKEFRKFETIKNSANN